MSQTQDVTRRTSRRYNSPFRIAGSRGTAISMPDVSEGPDSVRALASVLLGAAYADGEFTASEEKVIRKILTRLTGKEILPEALERQIRGFDPEHFSLEASLDAAKMSAATSSERILQLVREVCEADDSIHLDEDEYMVAIVMALQLAPEKYRSLVVKPSSGVNGFWKRVTDVVLASVALFFLAIPLGIIALAVRWTSPGPALFKQKRYGRGGKEIGVYKFRSMGVQENGPTVTQATKGDSRITPLGAFLRKSSLDELPQLFNVLMGDMSLVGPRPHAVAHNEQYKTQIIEYMLRHKIKPGITGWAQVNGWRGETDTLRKMVYRVEHDLDYIRQWNLLFDFKIMWLTVFGRKVRQNAY